MRQDKTSSQTQHAAPPGDGRARAWRFTVTALKFLIPLLVLWLAWGVLRRIDAAQVQAELSGASPGWIVAAAVAALFSTSAMGFYDALSFRRVPATPGPSPSPDDQSPGLPFHKRWALGTSVAAWSSVVGFGPALRALVYSRFGYPPVQVARGIALYAIASVSGIVGWALALASPGAATIFSLLWRAPLALFLSVLIVRVAAGPALHIAARWVESIETPSRGLLNRLGLVSFVDWGLAFVVMLTIAVAVSGVDSGFVAIGRSQFSGYIVGLLTMLPGGFGSADAVWVHGLSADLGSTAQAASVVLLLRCLAYLLPWLVASLCMYVWLAMHLDQVRSWQRRVVAGVVAVNAVLLLLAAATPVLAGRLGAVAGVRQLVPLASIEAGHLLCVLLATAMLFLLRGLVRGYRVAFWLTMALLLASAAVRAVLGAEWIGAAVAVLLAGLLFGARGGFLREGRVPIGWHTALLTSALALAAFWLTGMVAFSDVPYRAELWTTFAGKADASRFLRAGVLMLLLAGLILLREALRPAQRWASPTGQHIDRAQHFARAHAASADALLVGGGDKAVWFLEQPGSVEPRGMLLYQVSGDRLIVYKDPVLADGVEAAELLHAFLSHADALDMDPVFSTVSLAWIEHLHEFGFHFIKVSEEAIRPLTGFTMDGKQASGYRRTMRDMAAAGITFDWLEPPHSDALIDALRDVSDVWLARKGGHELQFSACYFSPVYLQQNPVVVARDIAGVPVAFVNVLCTRPGGPASIDFMRYRPDVVDGLMDGTIVRTMQWLAERGYASFSLGTAPMSDVGQWQTARTSERLLRLLSLRAERIYNYSGLRSYKRKFHPEWEPRYLAYRYGWDWVAALVATARLVKAGSRDDRRRIAAARMAYTYPEVGRAGHEIAALRSQ